MAANKRFASNGFRGLNNVTDPLRLSPAFQTQADNVDVSQAGELVRARGFTQRTTNFAIAGAYATRDHQRLYVVDAGELRQMHADLAYSVLATGLASARMHFEEVNGDVFYTNGVDRGLIKPDGAVRTWGIEPPAAPQASLGTGLLTAGTYRLSCTYVDPWGLESGNGGIVQVQTSDDAQIIVSAIPQRDGFTTNVYATERDGTVFLLLKERAGSTLSYNGGPNTLGRELPYWLKDAPRGILPALYQGRLHLAEAYPEHDLTIIWRSLPLQYHHFDYASEAPLVLPGTVRMQRACEGGLIIGTERAIVVWNGERVAPLADYGVVPGFHASPLDTQLYFWTQRGLARALPYTLLTEHSLSVAPGVFAGANVLERDGERRYVVALQRGGTAYNAR